MTTLSIRLPDDMAERLKNLAKHRDISLDKQMLELSTQALAEEEAKQRFLEAQFRSDPKRALQLLDELDGARGFEQKRSNVGRMMSEIIKI